MAGRLKGKVAVVTGAAPRGEGVGNGMATAILFAKEGARVVLVNRSAERAEKLAKQIGTRAARPRCSPPTSASRPRPRRWPPSP